MPDKFSDGFSWVGNINVWTEVISWDKVLKGCQHAQHDLPPEIGTLTPTVCPVNQALIADLPPNLDTDQMKAAHGRNVDAATGNFDQECRALKNYAALGDNIPAFCAYFCCENARGKTTMCAILRSLFTNTPAFIIGRRTLGSAGQPEVQLLTENGAVTFRNGSWSAAFPDIAVFDGTYVSDNVFAGDLVQTDHRRNLYRVIIGAQGVTLAASVNDLESQIRTKNGEIRDSQGLLQR